MDDADRADVLPELDVLIASVDTLAVPLALKAWGITRKYDRLKSERDSSNAPLNDIIGVCASTHKWQTLAWRSVLYIRLSDQPLSIEEHLLEFRIVFENYFYFIFDSTKTYVWRTYARRTRREKMREG